MGMTIETGGKKKRARPEMNVTPLVDVVLVLLIIFMVAMPAMNQYFWLHLPPDAEADAAPPDDPSQPIVVSVDARGQLRINRDAYADREFGRRLRRMLVAREERKVYFDADDEAPFERAVHAMDVARAAGASHIAVTMERLR